MIEVQEIYYEDIKNLFNPTKTGKYDSNEEKEDQDPEYNRWVRSGNSFFPAKNSNIVESLKSGNYTVINNNGQYSLELYDIEHDELYVMPNNDISTIISEVEDFWNKKDLFKKYNVSHKRGILFTGPPGTGKSSLINILSNKLVSQDGIIFHIYDANDLAAVINVTHSIIRVIEPERPIIIIIEDIDKMANYRDESLISNFLDGEDQIEHSVVIATTNKIQDLNDVLMRPSRFDWIIQINEPDENNRKFYFEQKGVEGEELELWVQKTKGYTMADLKELFIAVKLLDNDLDSVLKKLKGQKDMVQNTTFKPKIKTEIGYDFGDKQRSNESKKINGFGFGN